MKLQDMSREMRLMTLGMIIANIASMMYFPFLPLYLEDLGASIAQVGIFFTVMTIFGISFRIIGGWVSDNIGRIETIAFGGVMGFVAILGFTIAPSWEWGVIGALFGQIGVSLVGPSFQAYTAEQAPEGATGSTFGLVSGLFLTCEIIGPLLGGFMIGRWGFKTMMWTATAIFAVAASLRGWMGLRAEHHPKPLNMAGIRRDVGTVITLVLAGGLLLWLFVLDGFFDASFQIVMPYLPKYVTEIGGQSETTYGALFAASSVVAALAMWPGGIFADRYSERLSIALGSLTFATTWAIIVLFPSPVGFAIGFGLAGVAMALVGPAFSSLLTKAVPKESLGITFGVFWTALGVMAIPAPYIGGILYDMVSPETPFIVAGGMILIALPLALWKLRVEPSAEKTGLSPRATAEMMAASVTNTINKTSTGVFQRVDLTTAIDQDGSD